MRKSRFTEEQIINILKSVETGQRVSDACRTHAISEQTYHRWKAKYGGLDINQARRLKQLEDENRRLKTAVADLTLDNRMLKDVLAKSGKRRRSARGGPVLTTDLSTLGTARWTCSLPGQLQLALSRTSACCRGFTPKVA